MSDSVSLYFTNVQDDGPERQNASFCAFQGSKHYICVRTSSYFLAFSPLFWTFIWCFDLCQAKGCAQNGDLLCRSWKWHDQWLPQSNQLLNQALFARADQKGQGLL